MKRSFLLFIYLLFAVMLSAQGYLRIGYSASYYNMKNYNKMIERYNETRPWLDDQMGNMHWMFGPDIGAGIRDNSSGFEFYARVSKGVVSASGVDASGNTSTRYLKARDTYGGGQAMIRMKGPVAFTIGAEMSRFKSFTKVNDDEDYRITDNTFSIGLTPGIMIFMSKGIFVPVVQVYYTIPFIKEHHQGTWYQLDPNNFANEPEENMSSRAAHLGISISIAIGKDKGID